MVALAATLAVACGGGSSGSPTPFSTRSSTPSASTPEISGFASVYFINDQTGWAGGALSGDRGGVILATTDGGGHWQQQYSGAEAIERLEFVSPLVGWAVASPHRRSDESVTLLHTTDGGHTWQALAELSWPLSLDFVSSDMGRAVVGSGLDGDLIETTDSGKTWTPIATPSRLQSICFSDADHGWATSGGDILGTNDGGRTWSAASAAFTPAEFRLNPASVWCRDHQVVWALFSGGVAAGNEAFALYRTLDSGGHWGAVLANQLLQLPVPDGGPTHGPFSLVDDATAYFVGICGACGPVSASIRGTEDAGASWSAPVVIPALNWAYAIAFTDAEHGWAVGVSHGSADTVGPAQGIILATSDRGRTWRQQYP